MSKIHWYKIIIVGQSGKKMTLSLPATKKGYIFTKLEKHIGKKIEKEAAIEQKNGIITVEGQQIARIEKIVRLAQSSKKESE